METEKVAHPEHLQTQTHAMKRVAIVGTSGSGKTTLACQLGELLGIAAVELDALHWEPNWVEAPLELLRSRVEEALAGETWIVDGNYRKLQDITWKQADTMIWLDYSLWLVMARVIRRTFVRTFLRVELWNGNRERLWTALFSKDSILLWSLTSHRRNQRMYGQLTSQADYAHLTLIRHRSPRETREWLARLRHG